MTYEEVPLSFDTNNYVIFLTLMANVYTMDLNVGYKNMDTITNK